MKTSVLILFTVATTWMSCNRKTVYDQYGHTPIAGWEKSDTLQFSVKPMEAAGTYAEELGLRINGAYPFKGLTLIIEQHIYPAETVVRDTLNCALTDDNGNATGKGISYYQYNIPMKDLQLKQGDSLQVFIRHNMKREILPGISDVGLKMVRKQAGPAQNGIW